MSYRLGCSESNFNHKIGSMFHPELGVSWWWGLCQSIPQITSLIHSVDIYGTLAGCGGIDGSRAAKHSAVCNNSLLNTVLLSVSVAGSWAGDHFESLSRRRGWLRPEIMRLGCEAQCRRNVAVIWGEIHAVCAVPLDTGFHCVCPVFSEFLFMSHELKSRADSYKFWEYYFSFCIWL